MTLSHPLEKFGAPFGIHGVHRLKLSLEFRNNDISRVIERGHEANHLGLKKRHITGYGKYPRLGRRQ